MDKTTHTCAPDGGYSAIIGDNVYGFAPGEPVLIQCCGGMITAVERVDAGDLATVLDTPERRILDVRGKLVLPGLIDCHIHAIATGMVKLDRFLRGVGSLAALEAEVRLAAGDGREFVRLAGLDMSNFDPAELAGLDQQWLDDLLPGQALYIKSVEGHSAWFNSRAWERLGVDDVLAQVGAPAEQQAQMNRSGRVVGAAYEELTTPIYDSYSFAERRAGMELVIAEANRVGLVGLHCLEGYGVHRRHDFELILALDQRPEIDLTLYCRDSTPELARSLGVPRFGGCWCIDGAVGAYSAATSSPYSDDPTTCGVLYHTADALREWFAAGLEHGMQPCVHAIGDRAIAQALDVLARLVGEYDLHSLRPRVDHFVMGTTELARRAVELGAVSAMQPMFDTSWGGRSGGYASRLGPERAERTNPVGEMIRAGLIVGGSSDSYIMPLDPLKGMRAALNHHLPEMRVDFDTAVRMWSHNAAYLAHQEAERGSIEPGCQADLTIVDGTRELAADAAVAYTLKGGRVVYAAGG